MSIHTNLIGREFNGGTVVAVTLESDRNAIYHTVNGHVVYPICAFAYVEVPGMSLQKWHLSNLRVPVIDKPIVEVDKPKMCVQSTEG